MAEDGDVLTAMKLTHVDDLEEHLRELGLDPKEVPERQRPVFEYLLEYEGASLPKFDTGEFTPIFAVPEDPLPIAASLNHFLPRSFYSRVSPGEFEFRTMFLGFVEDSKIARAMAGLPTLPFPKRIGPSIGRVLKAATEGREHEELSLTARKNLKSLIECIGREDYSRFFKKFFELPRSFRRYLVDQFKSNQEEIESHFRLPGMPTYSLRELPLPDLLSFACAQIVKGLSENVVYLGPLRDDPKPIYSLPGATRSRFVGLRGEYTANALYIHKNTQVKYIPSAAFSTPGTRLESTSGTLTEALEDWLDYLGVARTVRTKDVGKLGHEMQVELDPGSPRDLAHVGVGVSQVLPILVASFLARENDLLIFEQPELHLHPRVQSRLADFLVCNIVLQKQCLVETHSSFLVDRLRYRAVTDPSANLHTKMAIFFAEKTQGLSEFTRVQVSEYGALNWPLGFFDEAESNSAMIIRAAMDKRRRQRGKRIASDPFTH